MDILLHAQAPLMPVNSVSLLPITGWNIEGLGGHESPALWLNVAW